MKTFYPHTRGGLSTLQKHDGWVKSKHPWQSVSVQGDPNHCVSQFSDVSEKLTRRSCPMRSLHFSNATLILRDNTSGDGSSMFGRPAQRSSRSSRSLIILTGRLLSVIHFTRRALKLMLACKNIQIQIIYRTSGFVCVRWE